MASTPRKTIQVNYGGTVMDVKVPENVAYPELYGSILLDIKLGGTYVWPSAYASGQLVARYKKEVEDMGARSDKHLEPYIGANTTKAGKTSGLTKWFGEKWVDLSRPIRDAKGNIIGFEDCGREVGTHIRDTGHYPKCRPEKQAMNMTDYEREMSIINKQIAEYSASEEAGRAPIMVDTIRENLSRFANCVTVMEVEVLDRTTGMVFTMLLPVEED
jgi:hypothetical protein